MYLYLLTSKILCLIPIHCLRTTSTHHLQLCISLTTVLLTLLLLLILLKETLLVILVELMLELVVFLIIYILELRMKMFSDKTDKFDRIMLETLVFSA